MAANPLTTLITRPLARRRLSRAGVIQTPNGIVERRYVSIGGIEQWITIRGEDQANPVLLFVHGGPGAVYSVLSPVLRAWERAFTVVQWDQRGAGKTYGKSGKAGPITFERLTRDGVELVEWLRQRLGQEKVILIGSSVGSLTGVMMVHQRPDLFWAYVGVDQNVGASSLRLSYQLTLDGLRAAGNVRGVRAVERIGAHLDRLTPQEATALHKWTLKATPGVPHMIDDIILPGMLTSPDHSLRDIGDIAAGMKYSDDQLFQEMMTMDLRALGPRFEAPFFIFQGDQDHMTPTDAARAYFDWIQAPLKDFVLIRSSGHLAAFTRPDAFLHELLVRVRPLATAQAQPVW